MRRTLFFVVGMVALAAGCGGTDPCAAVLCGPCAPALTVELHDGAGHAVSGVTIEGASTTCSDGGDRTVCQTTSGGAGHYQLTLRAPGFYTRTLDTDVAAALPSGGCCSCGYTASTLSVTLTRVEAAR